MRESLAFVHDYLTQRGGAERVVATWCREYRDTPLYTSLFDAAATFDDFRHHDVRTSWLNHIEPFRQHHRLALPLLAPVFSNMRLNADVVLASSSGWAHGVRTDGRLIVYCHAPARWLYQSERYLRSGTHGRRAHMASTLFSPALRQWDQRAARRADTYLVNSSFTRDLVREIYDIDAEILAPPVVVPAMNVDIEPTTDVLIVARLLPYKNVDLALAAAAQMPGHSFRVVGDGPLREALQRTATSNVTFVGPVSDDALWREYLGARLHLALSHEDFGITPLEAAACGRPTVARNVGGYLDTIVPASGIMIDDHDVTASSVREAIEDALSRSWSTSTLQAHAANFSPQRHLQRLKEVLSARPTTH